MHVAAFAVVVGVFLLAVPVGAQTSPADVQFEGLADRYVEQSTAFSPVGATSLGDHRYDHELNQVGAGARQKSADFKRSILRELDGIDAAKLSRANQVDYALLRHSLKSDLWRDTELQEWAWNPLRYTSLAGSSIYSLMARDFAPLTERLNSAAARLEQFPRLLEQVRQTLEPARVPKIHAETAVSQNRGVLNIIKNTIEPHLGKLNAADRARLTEAIALATQAVETQQVWLEETLAPAAAGEFRIGAELYDTKLAFSLHSPLSRGEIKKMGVERVKQLHSMMYEIVKPLYLEQYPLTRFPENPSAQYQRAIIRFGLELAYAQTPALDQVVATAKASLAAAKAFLEQADVITLTPDPIEIIIMPEFRRGVSLAYCDSPGALEKKLKTFYAVSPIPEDWTPKQTHSFLREYNHRSLDVLTIHEAMPGHFVQLAHSNRYPGVLRHLLKSGVFVEGWACYSEWMMCEEGFLDDDPLLKLVTLKWYLRDATNALLDQAVHVDGISRDEAMRMMVEDAFQEEREAAGKWVRAQLTAAQLSTYFVGYLEHVATRAAAEKTLGKQFDLKRYHDKILSFGSPPPQFAKALLLDLPIQQTGD